MIASTASPFKFSSSVLDAVAKEDVSQLDEFAKVAELSKCAKVDAPAALASLKDKPAAFAYLYSCRMDKEE